MTRISHAALAVGVGLFWLGPSARAQAADPPPAASPEASTSAPDPELDAELAELLDEPIVTTASKRQEKVSSAPATVFTITAEEIRTHGIRSLEEAINYLGNSVTAQPPYDEVGARGLLLPGDGGGHMLVLVNGHTTNGVWGGWQQVNRTLGVPIEIVERIELSLGPGSVLYGTSAMFGVINVVTKSPSQHEGLHVSVRGAISPPVGGDGAMRPATNGHRVGYDSRISLGWGTAFHRTRRGGGIAFQAEAYDTAAPTTSFGPQTATYEPGAYVATPGVWGGIARRRVRGIAGLVSLRAGRWQVDLMSTASHQYELFEFDSDFADPRNRKAVSEHRADVRHGVELGKRARLDSRVYGSGSTWVANWIYSDAAYWCPGLDAKCAWRERSPWLRVGVEERLTLDWLHDSRIVTMVGGEGRASWMSDAISIREVASGQPTPSDTLDARGASGAGAVYLQQTWWPVRRLALDGGLRFDIDQNFGWRASPRGAITVLPWHLASLKLLYAEAFRAPGLGELLYEDPNNYVRADHLRPEVVRSLELTLEQRFAGGHGSLKVGGFYNWWHDLIAHGPIDEDRFDAAVAAGQLVPEADIAYVLQYQNRGRIEAFGGFAALQAHALDRRLQLGLNLGVARAAAHTSDTIAQPLAVYPTVLGNARIAWVPEDPVPSLGLAALYNSPRRTSEDVSGAFANPRRAGHHGQLRATIDGAIPRTGGLRYSVSVDHNFATHAAYMVGPNRSDTDDPNWRGELYPLPQTTVIFGLRFDRLVGAVGRRAATPAESSTRGASAVPRSTKARRRG
jgi:outer membrane receptor protein involved in Fe transport